MRPIRAFSLVLKAFQLVWGLGTPNPPFVPFGPENAPFKLPKLYILKGKWRILKRKILQTGKNAKRTNGSIFTHVQRRGESEGASEAGGEAVSVFIDDRVVKWTCS